MLVSLPNSGSTWLAKQLALSIDNCRYYEIEYFNPLRNPKRFNRLRGTFGCELAQCLSNIARDVPDCAVSDAISETWDRDGYTFTKEVFSPYKLRQFAERFNCAVLVSESRLVFPPTRLRVYSFYEHAYVSLTEERRVHFPLLPPCPSVADYAIAAHDKMAADLVDEADRLGVPVLRYRDLLTGSHFNIVMQLAALGWPGLRPADAAARIFAGRRLPAGRERFAAASAA